jgi:hypothetical protein
MTTTKIRCQWGCVRHARLIEVVVQSILHKTLVSQIPSLQRQPLLPLWWVLLSTCPSLGSLILWGLHDSSILDLGFSLWKVSESSPSLPSLIPCNFCWIDVLGLHYPNCKCCSLWMLQLARMSSPSWKTFCSL